MKILFVAPRFHTNQVPFVEGLLEAGHDVAFDVVYHGVSEDHTIVTPTVIEPAQLSAWLQRRRAPTNLGDDHADHTFPSFWAYLQRLRAMEPDVIVIRDPNRPFSTVAAVAARLLGIKIVLYTQGDTHARPDRRKGFLRAVLLHGLNAQWYSSVSGDRKLPKVHERFHYLPLAADVRRTFKTSWFDDDRVHLLSVGKFFPRKNHLLLLSSFKALRDVHPMHLTLVGEVSTPEHAAHYAEVQAFARDHGLERDVTVATNVPFAQMGEVYAKHDVFVMPSRREPVGVSVLEAMAHGLPVVCSTTNGARWYVEPGRSGRIFESDDLEDLTRTLAAIVSDREGMRAMGARGRELVETVHHPQTVARAFEAIVATGWPASERRRAPP